MIEFEEFQSKLSSLNYSPTTNGGEPKKRPRHFLSWPS
ncbi:hypothetical protein MUA90_11280 [Staphylococcus sp. IVB6181]|nr:hypothetical protein [Staphylococcus sp. IVB6181]UXV34589.1 hypothetical protein MUA90_11280 [Staphylococcus sp. IVB6181]